jgi:hypothetical protein
MNEPKKITREELYERIWKMPATKLAKELGISDVALAKICRKLNVPKPGPGHWRLVQLGWEIERPALPALGKNAAVEAIIDPEAHRTGRSDLAGVGADGKQKPQFEVVPVPETLHGAHHLISRMKRLLEAEKPGWGGIVEVPWRLSVMEISVSRAQTGRALRLMDALVKALERRGATFEKSDEREFMHLKIGEEYVKIGLKELVDKTEREPRDEQERQSWSWKRDKWEFRATGKFEFRIFASEPKGARRSWSDCTRHRLDDKLGEIVETLFITAEGEKRARLAREERQRQWEEKWRRQEEERRRQEEARKRAERKRRIEEGNRNRLEESAQAWVEARRLRRFIRACEAILRKIEEPVLAGGWQDRWLAWAREHADRLDPMKNGFLEAECRRLATPGDQEEEEAAAESDLGVIMQDMMFGKGFPK